MRTNAPNASAFNEIPRMVAMHIFKKIIMVMLEKVYPLIQGKVLPPEQYSRPVREIYRVLTLGAERDKDVRMKERWEMGRDVICTILEWDDAYLSRALDLFSEINPEEMKIKYLIPKRSTPQEYFAKKDYQFGNKHEI